MTASQPLANKVAQAFMKAFGVAPTVRARAPGRVNLIGEHTDYNDGFVLPCALQFETVVAAGPAHSGIIETVALDFGGERDRFDTGTPIAALESGSWQNHIRGVAAEFDRRGILPNGARLAIGGNIPQNAGLSSSASLGVSVAAALAAIGDTSLKPTDLAQIAHASENSFVGCACGIMDQLVSARAEAGSALLIDCRSQETRPIPIPSDIAILVVHSGVERGLVGSAYNERRLQCEAAAEYHGAAALRDIHLDRLETDRAGLDETAYRRARHVISENARVEEFVVALQRGDFAAIGALMAQSHISMRDDFKITVPEIDTLVAIIDAALDGQGGARMTGGGFGGCVVAMLPNTQVEKIHGIIVDRYRTPKGAPPTIILAEPSRGVSMETI